MRAWSRNVKLARTFSLVDQGAQGVANILATLALGRVMAPIELGGLGTVIGLYYFVAGFHRSGVELPYITEHDINDHTMIDPPALGGPDEDRTYHSDWWWLNLVVALALAGALLAGAAAIALAGHWFGGLRRGVTPLLLAAMITPTLLSAEHMRRWLYKLGRPDLVALVAVVYAATMVGVAVVAAHFRPDAVTGSLAWFVAGLAATLLPLAWLRPSPPQWSRTTACFARHRRFAVWLALTNVPYAIYSSATVVIFISILNGPAAAGVFTAARSLTNPATSIVSAVDSIDKPRAAAALAHTGLAGLRRQIGRTRLLLILATGGYLAVIAAFAQPLLDLAFHHRYPDIAMDVRLLAAAFFMFCLNQPSETMLIVLRASTTLFVIRVATALLMLIALIVGSRYGIAGMALGMVSAQAGNLAFLAIAEHLIAARERHRLVAVA